MRQQEQTHQQADRLQGGDIRAWRVVQEQRVLVALLVLKHLKACLEWECGGQSWAVESYVVKF